MSQPITITICLTIPTVLTINDLPDSAPRQAVASMLRWHLPDHWFDSDSQLVYTVPPPRMSDDELMALACQIGFALQRLVPSQSGQSPLVQVCKLVNDLPSNPVILEPLPS